MKWIFKVLQGQHKGAELALPSEACLTAGRAPTCDLVLLDTTLPDKAFTLQCTDQAVSLTAHTEGITIGGHSVKVNTSQDLPLYTAINVGMTSFCIGEAGKQWRTIRTVKPVLSNHTPSALRTAFIVTLRSCIRISLMTIITLLLLSAGALGMVWWHIPSATSDKRTNDMGSSPPQDTLNQIIMAHALTLNHAHAGDTLSGNFTTPQERIKVSAQVAQLHPCITLDFTDDASLRTVAETILRLEEMHTLTIDIATNRTVTIGGYAPSEKSLAKTVQQLRQHIPYLRHIAVDATVLKAPAPNQTAPRLPNLPIIAITKTPYPYITLRDGRRLSIGAVIDGFTILDITPDEIKLQHNGILYQWKP